MRLEIQLAPESTATDPVFRVFDGGTRLSYNGTRTYPNNFGDPIRVVASNKGSADNPLYAVYEGEVRLRVNRSWVGEVSAVGQSSPLELIRTKNGLIIFGCGCLCGLLFSKLMS